MKNKRNFGREGFTLVELLIVIVVIGILSAMMMLSSTEAVTSARASNIISNLRNLKTAATAMYVDYQDHVGRLKEGKYQQSGGSSMDLVVKYMNNGGTSGGTVDASLTNYGICSNDKTWYVYIEGVDANVQKKLAGRAKSVGLYGGETTSNIATEYTTGSVVGMKVLSTKAD